MREKKKDGCLQKKMTEEERKKKVETDTEVKSKSC